MLTKLRPDSLKIACVYSLRIVASFVAFVFTACIKFPRDKIPPSEFLIYAPVLFSLCLSVPNLSRTTKQQYRPVMQSRSRLLEIERIRQVCLQLAIVAYNSRGLLTTLSLAWSAQSTSPVPSPRPDILALIICDGLVNVLLTNAGDSGISFDNREEGELRCLG
jgi:hypothetical protein